MIRTYTLPFPPSVNHYWVPAPRKSFKTGKFNRHAKRLSDEATTFRNDTFCRIIEQNDGVQYGPMQGRLSVHVDLVWPDNRERDLDNYWKGLFDALTHARVWLSDEQVIHKSITERTISLKPGGLRIRIENVDADNYHDADLARSIVAALR